MAARINKTNEITQLKYWLDIEFSYLHIFSMLIIALLGKRTWLWALFGVYVFVNIIYISRRLVALPKDYLKVKRSK